MSPGRSVAIARHALTTNIRTPLSWFGLGLLMALPALGTILSLRRGGGWALDDDLLVNGFTAAAIFALRSGLVEQRVAGLQTFLRSNFVTPVEHMAGVILSLLASWLLLVAVAFLVALGLSGGDLRLAGWMAWVLLLRSGILVPFALMVECVSDLTIPFFVPVLAYLTLLVTLAILLGVERAAGLLASQLDRTDPTSSMRLAARAAVILPAGLLLVLATTWLRSRRRRAERNVPVGARAA